MSFRSVFIFSGGETFEDGGDHLIMVLEGVVVVPRWSASTVAIVFGVILLIILEFLGQPHAVLHLVFGALVERAWSFKDFLVLLIVVALGAGLVDRSNDILLSVAAKLSCSGALWPVTAIIMATLAVIAVVVVTASFITVVIIAPRWVGRQPSINVLVVLQFGLLGIHILVHHRDHLADRLRRLAVEFGAKIVVVKPTGEGGDDFPLGDVGNGVCHL